MTTQVIAQRLLGVAGGRFIKTGRLNREMPVSRESVRDVDTDPGGKNGPGRRRAGRFVQSGRTSFFPVPVLRTSTTGRTVSLFPELNEPARPAAVRPVSHDMGGRAAGGSAVRTERRGQDRRIPTNRRP